MRMFGLYCPACGAQQLEAGNGGMDLTCLAEACPDRYAARKILADSEIHHIVRFNDGHFNAQHPLRERADDNLLDCAIHAEVGRWYADGGSTEGSTWRVKRRDDVEGEQSNEWPWLWEQIG